MTIQVRITDAVIRSNVATVVCKLTFSFLKTEEVEHDLKGYFGFSDVSILGTGENTQNC